MYKIKVVIYICICLSSLSLLGQNFNVETLQNIDFGMFTSGTNGGTITLESTGQASVTQDLIMIDASNTSAARFLVTTLSVVPLNITVSAPSVYLTNQRNQTILLDPNRISEESFTISVLQPKTIKIGGQLIVPGKLPGLYSGTLNIEFTFNTQ